MHRYEVRSVRALAADKSDPTTPEQPRGLPLKKRGTHDMGFDGTTSLMRSRSDVLTFSTVKFCDAGVELLTQLRFINVPPNKHQTALSVLVWAP